jgi:glutaredoxin
MHRALVDAFGFLLVRAILVWQMGYVLISRKGCHLCEEAEALLAAQGIAYTFQDVDADENLKNLYTFRVPVLLREGRVLLEGKFTLERLSKKLSL